MGAQFRVPASSSFKEGETTAGWGSKLPTVACFNNNTERKARQFPSQIGHDLTFFLDIFVTGRI